MRDTIHIYIYQEKPTNTYASALACAAGSCVGGGERGGGVPSPPTSREQVPPTKVNPI